MAGAEAGSWGRFPRPLSAGTAPTPGRSQAVSTAGGWGGVAPGFWIHLPRTSTAVSHAEDQTRLPPQSLLLTPSARHRKVWVCHCPLVGIFSIETFLSSFVFVVTLDTKAAVELGKRTFR